MAAIAGKEVLDEDFNSDRIKIAFNPLATDETKRFAVQDASHLKIKGGYRIFLLYLPTILNNERLKTSMLTSILMLM